MKNNKKHANSSGNYYLLRSLPRFYNKLIVPFKKINLENTSLLRGLNISTTVVKFKYDLSEDGSGVIKIPTTHGSITITHEPYADYVATPSKRSEFKNSLEKSIFQHQDLTLHRDSCLVKCKVTPQGSGVLGPIEGWYNSSKHNSLLVSDLHQFLCTSVTNDDLPYWFQSLHAYTNSLTGPSSRFFNNFVFSNVPDCNKVALNFLYLSLTDYYANKMFTQSLKLPDTSDVVSNKFNYFTWEPRKKLNYDLTKYDVSSDKNYFLNESPLEDLLPTTSVANVSNLEDFDLPALRYASNLSGVVA